jgi:hypothetical protein
MQLLSTSVTITPWPRILFLTVTDTMCCNRVPTKWQTLPTDTTQREILQKEHKALEARMQDLVLQL